MKTTLLVVFLLILQNMNCALGGRKTSQAMVIVLMSGPLHPYLLVIAHFVKSRIFLSGLQNGEEKSQEANSCQKEREPNRPNDTKVICHTDG
jgi:hypothetical protein